MQARDRLNFWLVIVALSCAGFFCQQAFALSVTFINPGRSDEAYWVAAGRAVVAAADDLGIHHEQFFAERDHLRVLEIARSIAARPKEQRPDYVMLTNDKLTLVAAVHILSPAGIKTFGAFSGLQDTERAEFGGPRTGFPLLIGTLEPRSIDAGYLTASSLIAQGLRMNLQGPDGKLHLISVAGDRSTPTSLYRNLGLRRALAEHPEVVLDQQVFGDWRRDKAAEQTAWLLRRHPDARLIWSASDQMTFGAMDALEKQGLQPGRDVLLSGINTSTEAMQAVISGRLAALAGGHFMAGAWAMVMIYDYEHGHDFADEGIELNKTMFTLFDKPATAERFLKRFGTGAIPVDFKHASKVLNPARKYYDFDFDRLLK
ncbi:ABC transporter substrate-binding protein [Roseateles koreensis]|uniref:ABC transporter substrate-binding protein n=1 Tax=Roseateles koreensis TaxID=2987526 RepID=A0ABT5KV22_9BURK|nr:ABC transporter substrate-binding protein [Roseateles koreensis]MDC8786661.1 ABC transporter substrate-binding protein [Roseateles koreensis]